MRKRIKASVRSTSSRIRFPRTRQPKPVTIGDLYEVRKVNYCVRTCTDAIAADVAKEGHIWEPVEGVEATPQQEAIKDQCDHLITHPNPLMTEHDLWNATSVELLIGADNFTEVVYKPLMAQAPGAPIVGWTPSELWPIEGNTMFIIPEEKTGQLPKPPYPAYEQVCTATDGIKFNRDEIIHISEGNIPGRLYGTPRLLSALMLIATQHQAIRYNLMTFLGQKYSKALLNVGEMTEEDLDHLVAIMQQQAEENPHDITLLSAPALNFVKMMDSNREMEFHEQLKFAERSICAVFRVPPIKIGISEAGGAGIVVGHTQMTSYWDNVEELQRQIAEAYNAFFYRVMGLRAYRLKLKSGRPEFYAEQATIEDVRIKNRTLTVNEARASHGLDPVPWGEEPPEPAAPAFSLQGAPQGPRVSLSEGTPLPDPYLNPGLNFRKGVAPGRMEDSLLEDPTAERVKEKTRSRMAGSWMRARLALLDVMDRYDIITKAPRGEGGTAITLDQLEIELNKLLEDWEIEADAIMAEGNAQGYAQARVGMIKDLDVEVDGFGRTDAERLRDIQSEMAAQPIRTFRDEQRGLIEAAVGDAYAQGYTETYQIRNRIEQNWRQFSNEETWKLDRIVRTSIGKATRTARAGALVDSGVQECKVITANDGRVRPSHRALHNQVVPIREALEILDEPNCRCRIVKPTKKPKTVPPPEQVLAEIEGARHRAEEALGVEPRGP